MKQSNNLKNKKVLHIAYSGLGGQSTVALSVPDADTKNFYSHHFVFFGIENPHPHNLERAKSIGAIKSISHVLKKVGFDFGALYQLYKLLKKSKPDVIISHMPSVFLPLFFYKLIRKVKIIFVEHHSLELRGKKSFVTSNFNLLFANKVICLTDNYRLGYLSRLFFAPKYLAKKIVVQANAINEKKFSISNKVIDESNSVNIAMVGRFNLGKDHPTLLKAVAKLAQDGYSINLILPGDGETLNVCKELSEVLGINTLVTFPGMISEAGVIKVLQDADIFVLATAGETQSLSILQAMACGVPVVASRVAGVIDMIQDGKTGFLFEHGHSDDLAVKIASVITDKTLVETAISNATEYFNLYHSYATFFQSYKSIIEE